MRCWVCTVLAVILAALLTGCGSAPTNKASGNTPSKDKPAAAAAPANLFLTAAPADAKDVGDVKKVAKEGEEVVIRGRIGGAEKPFVASGMMLIASVNNPEMKHCGENPGDGCPTPWDYCCMDKKVITANTATIEIAGPDGKPLASTLEGMNGLKPMQVVVVKGKVGKRENEGVLNITASGIYIEPEAKKN